MDLYGFNSAYAARRLGVSRESARRWQRGSRPAPVAMQRLARILLAGDLAEISRTWDGWRLVNEQLVSPDNVCWTPGQLAAYYWQLQLLSEYRRQLTQPGQTLIL